MVKKATAMRTYHEGANDERTVILAKIRRELDINTKIAIRERRKGPRGFFSLWDLDHWITKRVQRYRARKGGL